MDEVPIRSWYDVVAPPLGRWHGKAVTKGVPPAPLVSNAPKRNVAAALQSPQEGKRRFANNLPYGPYNFSLTFVPSERYDSSYTLTFP